MNVLPGTFSVRNRRTTEDAELRRGKGRGVFLPSNPRDARSWLFLATLAASCWIGRT
jgi:hypothetical protein